MHQHLRSGLWLVLVCICGAAPASADPTFKVSLSKDKLRPGAAAVLSIQASWPKSEAQYRFAIPEFLMTNLSIANRGESQESFAAGGEEWVRKTFTFELTAGKPGPARIEIFTIPYVDPLLQKNGAFEHPALDLLVGKPTIFTLRNLAWVSASGFGILGMIVLAGLFTRRRKPAPAADKPHIPMPAAVEAAQEDPFKFRPMSDLSISELSAQFRSFLTESYKLPVPPSATEEEIKRCLERTDISREEMRHITGLLKELNDAKYSGLGSPRDLERIHSGVAKFLQSKQAV